MRRLSTSYLELDAVDARLLEALAEDARRSIADLARQIGLSPPSVSERLNRLEEAGVIRRYTIELNPAALGRPLSVWLRVRPIPGQLQKVIEILRGLPEVVECDRVTGDDCFLARAHVRDAVDLERLIDHLVAFASTNTAVIQSPPIERRLPPLTWDSS